MSEVQTVDDLKFHPDGRGYYRNYQEGGFLHRYAWEKAHGPIPEDCVIHHIDGDTSNNDIDNLACLSNAAHMALHIAQGEIPRSPGFEKMREGSVKWVKSAEGREFYSKKSKRDWETRKQYDRNCAQCSGPFKTYWPNKGKYCSNKCRCKANRTLRAKRNEQSDG